MEIRCTATNVHFGAWTHPQPPNTSVLGGFLSDCYGAARDAEPSAVVTQLPVLKPLTVVALSEVTAGVNLADPFTRPPTDPHHR